MTPGRHLAGVRGRVALTVLVVTAALYTVLGTLLFLQVVRSGRQSITQRIEEVLDQLETQTATGQVAVGIDTADGVTARVIAGGGDVPPAQAGELQVVRPVAGAPGPLVLVGTASTRNLNRSLRPLHRALWVGVPAAALFTAAVAGAATDRALRPVDGISRLAARIGPDAAERVPVPPTDDEIRHLALTVNGMLDRISGGRRAMDRFTTDAAHELRTPLMALQGELELSARGLGDEASLGRMQHQAARLAELVDDLVLLSGLHEGGRPLHRSPVDLAELVQAEAVTAAPTAEVVIASAPGAVIVDGDRRLLARAVRNLLTNAQRHATGRVAVSVGPDPGGRWAELIVDDDGPGVPDDQLTGVFERFARLDEARSADAGGSGLGLAIVAGVASAHDGTVVASHSPLGGARFTLRLPLNERTEES